MVPDGDHRFLELRGCPAGQVLLATGTGWECGAVQGAGGGVAEVVAGNGVQVTHEGQTRRVGLQYAGSGGELGVEATAARSDHGHGEFATLGEELDQKADQAAMTTALATKADQAAVDQALATKAGQATLDELRQLVTSLQATLTAQQQALTAQEQALATLRGEVTIKEGRLAELERRQADPCPPGWQDAGDPAAPVCERILENGAVDEMVRIGDFLIDRYEASLYQGYALDLTTGAVVAQPACTWGPPEPLAGGCLGQQVRSDT